MMIPRVIPCLLLQNNGLVKTIKFDNPVYIGDPINAVRIFNEKGVDELIFLDISVTKEGRSPNFSLLRKIASECFMPLCYGGGLKCIDDIKQVFQTGVEKIALNRLAFENPSLVEDTASLFGAQSLVVSMDVKKDLLGRYRVFKYYKKNTTKKDPISEAMRFERLGVGELLINAVDKDGTMTGYDIPLMKEISSRIDIPVIACGGAGKKEDFLKVIRKGGVSAVAAGSMFVFYGMHRAVLINYPSRKELKELFSIPEMRKSHD